MYSNTVYASAWKATNGFIESMVDEEPSRNTPPFLTAPPPEVVPPQPAAARARARTAAAAVSRIAGRDGRSVSRRWNVNLIVANLASYLVLLAARAAGRAAGRPGGPHPPGDRFPIECAGRPVSVNISNVPGG